MHAAPLYLALPFVAGGIFALGSLCLKRSFREGAVLPLTLFTTNCTVGLAFLPLLLFAPGEPRWNRWYQPFLAGGAYFLGQLANFLALRFSDVSLVTPMLSTKVIFVVLIGWLWFGTTLRPEHGVAALLTTAGVWVMSAGGRGSARRPTLGVALALLSGLSFALCDLLLQRWATDFGLWQFLPLMFAAVTAQSLLLLPWVGQTGFRAPFPAWKWLLAGAAMTAGQSMLISGSIGWSHDATGVNVVYTLRGLWALALVWLIGSGMGNTERAEAAKGVFGRRLAGTVLIIGAVVLAVVSSAK
ncbi:MAG TPA: DMT family transporter [Candidatus Limnocylindria bacterium]|nr:DMT family transporter [Candidatus Limnocylindria bacterium]